MRQGQRRGDGGLLALRFRWCRPRAIHRVVGVRFHVGCIACRTGSPKRLPTRRFHLETWRVVVGVEVEHHLRLAKMEWRCDFVLLIVVVRVERAGVAGVDVKASDARATREGVEGQLAVPTNIPLDAFDGYIVARGADEPVAAPAVHWAGSERCAEAIIV